MRLRSDFPETSEEAQAEHVEKPVEDDCPAGPSPAASPAQAPGTGVRMPSGTPSTVELSDGCSPRSHLTGFTREPPGEDHPAALGRHIEAQENVRCCFNHCSRCRSEWRPVAPLTSWYPRP